MKFILSITLVLVLTVLKGQQTTVIVDDFETVGGSNKYETWPSGNYKSSGEFKLHNDSSLREGHYEPSCGNGCSATGIFKLVNDPENINNQVGEYTRNIVGKESSENFAYKFPSGQRLSSDVIKFSFQFYLNSSADTSFKVDVVLETSALLSGHTSRKKGFFRFIIPAGTEPGWIPLESNVLSNFLNHDTSIPMSKINVILFHIDPYNVRVPWGSTTHNHDDLVYLIDQIEIEDVVECPEQLVVNKNADSGPGSLRQAIICANKSSDFSTITFAPLASGEKIKINLTSALPSIIFPVDINGAYQHNGQTLLAELNGTNAGVACGLKLFSNASNSIIRNLRINNFSKYGIYASSLKYISVSNNIIDFSGDAGIYLTSVSNSQVSNNVITRGKSHGVSINNSLDNDIFGNFIGTNLSNQSLGNTGKGINIRSNSFNNRIGLRDNKNVISNNSSDGIGFDLYVLGSIYSYSKQNTFSNNELNNNGSAIEHTSRGVQGNDGFPAPVIERVQYFKAGYAKITGTGYRYSTIEIFLSDATGKNATTLLKEFNNAQYKVHVNDNGDFEMLTTDFVKGQSAFFVATQTDLFGNTSELSDVEPLCYIPQNPRLSIVQKPLCDFPQGIISAYHGGEVTTLDGLPFTYSYQWKKETIIESEKDYGFKSLTPGKRVENLGPGNYRVYITPNGINECTVEADLSLDNEDPYKCDLCVSSFSPDTGDIYRLSAWVSEDYINVAPETFTAPFISFEMQGFKKSVEHFHPSGPIIDGWQKIEGIIKIPIDITELDIVLNNRSSDKNVYFDDIRIFPKDGNMVSFVYDPQTLKLVASLDENNFATYYEYDAEGKLVSTKKETDRGKVTIVESRSNTRR